MQVESDSYIATPILEKLSEGPRWGSGAFDEATDIDVGDNWVVVITEDEAEQLLAVVKAAQVARSSLEAAKPRAGQPGFSALNHLRKALAPLGSEPA